MKINEENIKKLTKNKERFLDYSQKIKDKFDGPSGYFYMKVIRKRRVSKKLEELLENNNYIEYLYATLATWGMHRMDKNTRMADFPLFKKSILDNKAIFSKLSQIFIKKVDLDEIKEDVLKVFKNLKVMARDNAPRLVANSKIMHFILPDLIPPVDRGQILYFYFGKINSKGNKYIPSIRNEEEVFWEVLMTAQRIAKELNLNENDLQGNWNASIPKIIDNAIIGFNEIN